MEDNETTDKDRISRVRRGISQDPAVMVGKPVVKGIRIPVELVLGHLAHTFDLDDLFAAYPHLTLEDVKACLEYARRAVVERRGETAGQSLLRLAEIHGKGPADLSSRIDEELYSDDA